MLVDIDRIWPSINYKITKFPVNFRNVMEGTRKDIIFAYKDKEPILGEPISRDGKIIPTLEGMKDTERIIRIASESARIGIVFNRRGVIPEISCPWILPRIIGLSRAAELMYTGRIINAKEALEYGLVSRVVPDDKLMETAREIADEILLCACKCFSYKTNGLPISY